MTDPSENSSPPKRRRGAPLGNANAVKHGFYARQFHGPVVDEVENINEFNLEHEIELMRLTIDRLLNSSQTVTSFSESIELTRTLTLASNCITRLMFAYNRVKRYQGGGQTLTKAINNLLAYRPGRDAESDEDEGEEYDEDEEEEYDEDEEEEYAGQENDELAGDEDEDVIEDGEKDSPYR